MERSFSDAGSSKKTGELFICFKYEICWIWSQREWWQLEGKALEWRRKNSEIGLFETSAKNAKNVNKKHLKSCKRALKNQNIGVVHPYHVNVNGKIVLNK